MQRVLANEVEHDKLSVIRATAVALGLPLLVLEARENELPATLESAPDAAPGALVFVMRRPRDEAKSRLAVARDVEGGAPQDPPSPSSARVSGEGGIVRFTLGDREERVAS